jgi:hypothetical protein
MKKKCIALYLMVTVLSGAALFAQTDKKFDEAALSIADKVKFELEFNASILSVDSEGVVDSMTDSGFNEDGTKIGLSYEDELWGGSAALKFGNENLRFLSGEIGELFAGSPLTIDELYGWVKPFGAHFKFTGGIFANTDGVAGYTDDIDDYSMGVFMYGEEGEPFTEPVEYIDTTLTSGLLTDVVFGPVTVQLLLAPNYSKERAGELVNDLLDIPTPVEAEERFLRMGGRIIADIGVGTVSALFKTFQWPMTIVNIVEQSSFPGTKVNWTTFGAYFDLTAVENLGVSVGYTGFIPINDADVDNILHSGIDLRATWTGIPGLSLSTHNNISFIKGAENEWMGALVGKDSSFFLLYNAIGATKELNDQFSINAEISNVFSKTDLGAIGKLEYDGLGIAAKLIAKVTENAEFNAGLRLDVAKTTASGGFGDADDVLTTFSVPVGIILSF